MAKAKILGDYETGDKVVVFKDGDVKIIDTSNPKPQTISLTKKEMKSLVENWQDWYTS